jgi:hypothetical protein
VPPRPVLNATSEAEIAGYVAGSKQALRVGDNAGEVMQPWPGAGHEHRIGRIVLSMHEDSEDMSGRPRIREVGRGPKTEAGVEGSGLGHIGHGELEVIQAERPCAPVKLVVDVEPLARFHSSAEFQRHAVRIGHPQRALLKIAAYPLGDDSGFVEMAFGAVKIVIAKHSKADRFACGAVICRNQSQTVMSDFLDATHMDRVFGHVGDDEADHFFVEDARSPEIGRRKANMTRARQIEWRLEIGRWNCHLRPPFSFNRTSLSSRQE